MSSSCVGDDGDLCLPKIQRDGDSDILDDPVTLRDDDVVSGFSIRRSALVGTVT